MVLLRLTVKVLPPEVVTQTRHRAVHDAQSKPTSFLLVLRNPENVTLGELCWMIREKWAKLRPDAPPLDVKKLLDDEHDTHDLDLDLTVADVFVDNGKAAADGLDQRATVRVVPQPTTEAPPRFGSVLQDWNAASSHYAHLNAAKFRPPVPLFPGVNPHASQIGPSLAPGFVLPGSSDIQLPIPEVAESEYHAPSAAGEEDTPSSRRSGEMSPVLGEPDDATGHHLTDSPGNTVLIPSLASKVRLSLDAQTAALRDFGEQPNASADVSASAEKPKPRSQRVSLLDRLAVIREVSPSAKATTRGAKRRRSSIRPVQSKNGAKDNDEISPPRKKRLNTSHLNAPLHQNQTSPTEVPGSPSVNKSPETHKLLSDNDLDKVVGGKEPTTYANRRQEEILSQPARVDETMDGPTARDATQTEKISSTPDRQAKRASLTVADDQTFVSKSDPEALHSPSGRRFSERTTKYMENAGEESVQVPSTPRPTAISSPLSEPISLPAEDNAMEVDTPPATKTPKENSIKTPTKPQGRKLEAPPHRPLDNGDYITVDESTHSDVEQPASPNVERKAASNERRASVQVSATPKATQQEASMPSAKSSPAKSSPAKRRLSIEGVDVVDPVNVTCNGERQDEAPNAGPGPGQMGLGITKSPSKSKPKQTAKRQGVSVAEMRRLDTQQGTPLSRPKRSIFSSPASSSAKLAGRAISVDDDDIESNSDVASDQSPKQLNDSKADNHERRSSYTSAFPPGVDKAYIDVVHSQTALEKQIRAAEEQGRSIREVSQMKELLSLMKEYLAAKESNKTSLADKLHRQLESRQRLLDAQREKNGLEKSSNGNIEKASNSPSPQRHQVPGDSASSPPKPALLPSPLPNDSTRTSAKQPRTGVEIPRSKRLFRPFSQGSPISQKKTEAEPANVSYEASTNVESTKPAAQTPKNAPETIDVSSSSVLSSSSSESSSESESDSGAQPSPNLTLKEKRDEPETKSHSESESDSESAPNETSASGSEKASNSTKHSPGSSKATDSSESEESEDDQSEDQSDESAADKAGNVRNQKSDVSASKVSKERALPDHERVTDDYDSSSSDSDESDDSDAESDGSDIQYVSPSMEQQQQQHRQKLYIRRGLGRARLMNSAKTKLTTNQAAQPVSSPSSQHDKRQLTTFSQPVQSRMPLGANGATPGRRPQATLKSLKNTLKPPTQEVRAKPVADDPVARGRKLAGKAPGGK
ncbi:hypothetical protein VTO42DRAFT_6957 [Malbranchea cinnamomea]